MGWGGFAMAFGAFFLSHWVLLRPPLKARFVAVLGARGFSGAYSVLSVLLLVWLIRAARQAPFVPLWPRAIWQTHVTLALMLGACVLFALCIGRPNPFSFGGRGGRGFDPARPGIIRWMRHPLLGVLALWSGAHLIPNGDLAHVILFGGSGGFALLGMAAIDRRRRRAMGARWQACVDRVGAAPRVGPIDRQTLVRLACGVGLWGAVIALHPVVIGLSVWP